MFKGLSKIFLLILLAMTLSMSKGIATSNQDEQHILAALRLIGHEILLKVGDSTSRVLPITKEGHRYKIPFEAEFGFNPVDLSRTVDSIVKQAQIAKRYIVSAEHCETTDVAYSYEVIDVMKAHVVPCGRRSLPQNCYNLWFTILEDNGAEAESRDTSVTIIDSAAAMMRGNKLLISVLIFSLLSVVGWVVFYQKKNKKAKTNPNMLAIGDYQFDRLNSVLWLNDQQQELSGKESDLLFLLNTSANTTLERDLILREVWGDEGSYVGRTLDVFVSKLRKKLEGDPNVKIVNIRGVGYKLILNGQDSA